MKILRTSLALHMLWPCSQDNCSDDNALERKYSCPLFQVSGEKLGIQSVIDLSTLCLLHQRSLVWRSVFRPWLFRLNTSFYLTTTKRATGQNSRCRHLQPTVIRLLFCSSNLFIRESCRNIAITLNNLLLGEKFPRIHSSREISRSRVKFFLKSP